MNEQQIDAINAADDVVMKWVQERNIRILTDGPAYRELVNIIANIITAKEKELATVKAQRDALAEACRAQQKIIDAQTALLVSYRIGRQPSERTLIEVSKRERVQVQAQAALAQLEDA